MLKNELDEKVRKYKLEKYGTPEERAEREKKHRAEVKEVANYEAKLVWEKMRKKFIANCKDDQPITFSMGIGDNVCVGTVFYRRYSWQQYRKLFLFRKVKYIGETMDAIIEIAKQDGIGVTGGIWKSRMRRFLVYESANWYTFTYNPSKR